MTGYGRGEQTINEKTFLVEVRSLNGKQYDIRLLIPALLKPFEFDVRSTLNEGLLRGSIECTISIKQNGGAKPVVINTELLKAYFNQVSDLSKELDVPMENILSTLLKLPRPIRRSSLM
jgi:uncharacterized protein (TIGR00255 family)